MNTYELIELAVLDALGILEPHESDEFEAAFAQADQHVQGQVRAEQARLTDIEHLLPEDQPRPELRDLVLSAVRASIDADRVPVAGRIGPRPAAQPRIKTAPRVSPAWRAASVALAAVLVSLFVFNAQTRGIFNQAQQIAIADGFIDSIGSEFAQEVLADPSTVRLSFVPVSNNNTDNTAKASAWHHESMDGQSIMFVDGLKGDENARYRVAILDEDGNIVKELTSFSNDAVLKGVQVNIDIRTIEQPLAITRIAEGSGSDFTADEILMVAKNQS